MLSFSIANYIPKKYRSFSVFKQVIKMVDYLITNDYVNSEKLSKRYYDLANKYVDSSTLQVDMINELIKEEGYEYIINAFPLSEEVLRTFIDFLTVIHLYKGSQEGLELVFRLVELTDYKITNFWEKVPYGEEYTIDLELGLTSDLYTENTRENIYNFIKNYIYPDLSSLILTINFDVDIKIAAYYQFSKYYVAGNLGDILIWNDEINGYWNKFKWG